MTEKLAPVRYAAHATTPLILCCLVSFFDLWPDRKMLHRNVGRTRIIAAAWPGTRESRTILCAASQQARQRHWAYHSALRNAPVSARTKASTGARCGFQAFSPTIAQRSLGYEADRCSINVVFIYRAGRMW